MDLKVINIKEMEASRSTLELSIWNLVQVAY